MSRLTFLLASVAGRAWMALATCLPNGLTAELRKNLSSSSGESYPVGVVLGSWSSAHVTSAVLEILIEEVLGYHLAVHPHEGSSLNAIYAMLGCATWKNPADRGCDNRKTTLEYHLMSESWYLTFPAYYDLAKMYPGEIPVNGGDMGYKGTSGQYVPRAILDEAENATGLALEYHKSYNPRWFEPWRYFDNGLGVNTSNFRKCEESGLLIENASMFGYWKNTGDDGGVTIINNTYGAFCPDGFFWRSPSCRNFPGRCILCITGGDGWDVRQMMEKSAVFSMPIALGVANSQSNYASMPQLYKSLLYWWTPDDTFIALDPQELVFPPHNAFEWLQQVFHTAGKEKTLAKLISYDLERLAPDIVKLLQRSAFDVPVVNSMMGAMIYLNISRKAAACAWLNDNTERWVRWIPDARECELGFGLYDETGRVFAATREAASICRACLPGTHSKPLADDSGTTTTYICEACPAGQQQPAAGANACEVCPTGTSKRVASVESCVPCASGFYQDEEGTTSCKRCPEKTTTVLKGAARASDCVCMAGTIDVSPTPLKECVACAEGLSCPDGGTLDLLKSGQNDTAVPEVLSGYFSTQEAPLSMYKCPMPHCPGGRPGTCQGDRVGLTCAECPEGKYWADDACVACEVSVRVYWIVGIIAVFLLMIMSYYITDTRYVARASVKECVGISMDMTFAFAQNLGILGAVQVPWPEGLRDLFKFSSVFVLNLQTMGFNCASHGDLEQYLLCAVLFVAVTAALPTLGLVTNLVSPLKSRGLSWNFHKTLCVMGKFLQSTFTTMCNIGMVPLMCFLHPNGQLSILKYPNTFCSSTAHWIMQIGGVVVLFVAGTHFILCTWACYQAPAWSRSAPHRLESIGFLLSNFKPSTYGFGLVYLVRGPLLSLPAVVATNSPAITLTLMICLLQVCFALQLYFLPWKAPILNIVDSLSTMLFLILLAISMHLEPSLDDSLQFLDTLGIGVYYLSIGVIACVCIGSVVLLVLERCFTKTLGERLVNLGELPDAEELVLTLEVIKDGVQGKDGKVKKLLLKKMSLSMGAYDLRVVRAAFDILLDDCELRPDVSDGGKRLAAKRISQMSRQEIASLGPEQEDSEEKEIESSDLGETNAEGAILASGDADLRVQDETVSIAF